MCLLMLHFRFLNPSACLRQCKCLVEVERHRQIRAWRASVFQTVQSCKVVVGRFTNIACSWFSLCISSRRSSWERNSVSYDLRKFLQQFSSIVLGNKVILSYTRLLSLYWLHRGWVFDIQTTWHGRRLRNYVSRPLNLQVDPEPVVGMRYHNLSDDPAKSHE